jgi:hypothetical protein
MVIVFHIAGEFLSLAILRRVHHSIPSFRSSHFDSDFPFAGTSLQR